MKSWNVLVFFSRLPFSYQALRREWLGNVRGDLLAGLVVALALIPEAISFSIIAGVDPKVGLYASFSIAVITAIAVGRLGMISAATAAMSERLDRAVQRLRMSEVATRSETIPGEPEAVLGRKVDHEGFDLLVMGAYGHSRICSLMVGSTTTAMIQAFQVPVLLYR